MFSARTPVLPGTQFTDLDEGAVRDLPRDPGADDVDGPGSAGSKAGSGVAGSSNTRMMPSTMSSM